MSTRKKMIDATARHQVFLQRYAGSQAKQILGFVNNLQKKITSLMPKEDTLTKARYVKLIDNFKDYSSSLNKSMVNGVTKNLKELATYEAKFTGRLVNQAANSSKVGFETVVPSTSQLHEAAFASIMDSTIGKSGLPGKTVGETLEQYGFKVAGTIINSIRQGYATGTPTHSIVKEIEDYVGTALVRNQINSVARTVTNYVANSAKESFYKENDDLITGYQVVATLDDSTSFECMALDGQVFDKEDFDAPPYHWNCRSTYIGVIDKQYNVSTPDAVRPSKNEDGTEEVNAGTTYNSWLKEQSKEFQDEVLGPTRGEMFRGGASVQSFVDSNYQPYSIEELKTKDEQHN